MPQAIPVIIAAATAAVAPILAGASIGVIIGTAALAGTLALVAVALTPKPGQPEGNAVGTQKGITRSSGNDGVIPARWVLGRARVGGVLAYWHEHIIRLDDPGGPIDNSVENGKLQILLVLCEGPILGLGRIWANGEEIGLLGRSPSGLIQQGYYDRFTSTPIRDFKMRLWTNGMRGSDGNSEYIPSEPNEVPGMGTWSPSDTLDGKVVVLIELNQPRYVFFDDDTDNIRQEEARFTQLPNFEFEVYGTRIKWPGLFTGRTTSNAAAIRYWWMTERLNIPPSAIDEESFREAYDICEERIQNELSRQQTLDYFPAFSKRYEINGVVYSNDDSDSVSREMDFSWAGNVVDSGGRFYFRPGYNRSTTVHITDNDIIERGPINFGPPLSQRVNVLNSGLAQNQVDDFQQYNPPPVEDTEAIAKDRERLPADLGIRAYTTDPTALDRLLKIALIQNRSSLSVSYRVYPRDDFELMALIPTDTLFVTDSEYDLVDQFMVVNRIVINEDMSVELDLQELDRSTYISTPPVVGTPDDDPDADPVIPITPNIPFPDNQVLTFRNDIVYHWPYDTTDNVTLRLVNIGLQYVEAIYYPLGGNPITYRTASGMDTDEHTLTIAEDSRFNFSFGMDLPDYDPFRKLDRVEITNITAPTTPGGDPDEPEGYYLRLDGDMTITWTAPATDILVTLVSWGQVINFTRSGTPAVSLEASSRKTKDVTTRVTPGDTLTFTFTGTDSSSAGERTSHAIIEETDTITTTGDVPGIVTSPAAAFCVLEGSTATFTVRLATQPTDNVRVLTVQIPSEITVATDDPVNDRQVIFTPQNWNIPRTFTVTGLVDTDTDDDTVTLMLRATGSGYSGLFTSLAITVIDTTDGIPDPLVTDIPQNVIYSEDGGFFSCDGTVNAYYITYQWDRSSSFDSVDKTEVHSELLRTSFGIVYPLSNLPQTGQIYVRARFTTGLNGGGDFSDWSTVYSFTRTAA